MLELVSLVLCDCAIGAIVNPRVHVSIIIGVSGSPSFNIFTRVFFSNYKISIVFAIKKKTIN
jgi:hypothetical protein